jgi:catechol 2,3-dioxygenase
MDLRPQITHLGLYTPNMEAMERFYTGVMGLLVTDRGRVPRLGNVAIVFMSADPACHHQVVLIEGPGSSHVQQISFRVQSLQDLREARDRLVAARATVTPIDHGNAWSVYSSDPDGNGIEVYLDSPWQVAQPHGRALDLSLSDAQIHAATEAAIRDDATFQPAERWQDDFRRRLRTRPR